MENTEEMEMPCPCNICGEWFDLNDGFGSKKWYPNTVICEPCYQDEKIEIEDDELEQRLLINIGNRENVRYSKSSLKSIGRPYQSLKLKQD